MDHTEVIDKIFKLRKKLGFSQKFMAERINVSSDTLSRWENKKNVPSRLALRKMEEILGFRPEHQKEKIASGRIEEALKIMHRLRGEKSSDTGEKNK